MDVLKENKTQLCLEWNPFERIGGMERLLLMMRLSQSTILIIIHFQRIGGMERLLLMMWLGEIGGMERLLLMMWLGQISILIIIHFERNVFTRL